MICLFANGRESIQSRQEVHESPELPALIERADREHLTPDQIKREIKNWVPDTDRT